MRRILCHILMFAVLYMSVDGAIDIASQGHPHGDEPAQQNNAELRASTAEPSDSDPLSDGEHSEHCCHGHAASIVMQLEPASLAAAADQEPVPQPEHASLGAQAPPTPPPNA